MGPVYPPKGIGVIKSLGTAEKAMQLQQNRIDALANNLANVNTAGFKQILNRVAEVGGSVHPQSGDAQETTVPRRLPAEPTLTMYHALDDRPGTVRPTGRDTDVAVMGEGYFEVSTPGGSAYTRHGSFMLDAAQRLTTPDGHEVMGEKGPIRLEEGRTFWIANDGAVMIDGKLHDRLKLVAFDDPTRLEHLGGSLVAPPAGLGYRTLEAPEVVVAQGHLEGSNVNPVDTLIAMIAAQRAFEVQSKVLTTEDEMLEKSVNELPRIKG
jgi:flagellar basal-body rod protein FlgG